MLPDAYRIEKHAVAYNYTTALILCRLREYRRGVTGRSPKDRWEVVVEYVKRKKGHGNLKTMQWFEENILSVRKMFVLLHCKKGRIMRQFFQ